MFRVLLLTTAMALSCMGAIPHQKRTPLMTTRSSSSTTTTLPSVAPPQEKSNITDEIDASLALRSEVEHSEEFATFLSGPADCTPEPVSPIITDGFGDETISTAHSAHISSAARTINVHLLVASLHVAELGLELKPDSCVYISGAECVNITTSADPAASIITVSCPALFKCMVDVTTGQTDRFGNHWMLWEFHRYHMEPRHSRDPLSPMIPYRVFSGQAEFGGDCTCPGTQQCVMNYLNNIDPRCAGQSVICRSEVERPPSPILIFKEAKAPVFRPDPKDPARTVLEYGVTVLFDAVPVKVTFTDTSLAHRPRYEVAFTPVEHLNKAEPRKYHAPLPMGVTNTESVTVLVQFAETFSSHSIQYVKKLI